MKPQKVSRADANVVDLGTKRILEYRLATRLMSVAYMEVHGRHPAEPSAWLLEHDCAFIIYVTKGTGAITTGGERFTLKPGDVMFVPPEQPFALEGDLEYVTVDVPPFYPKQSETITR